MSIIQRERLDAHLRGAGVGSEQSVRELRESFVKLMSTLPVPEGIRVVETSLGGRHSAGGGLTITGALAARDAGLPMPAAIVAFSPGVDATRAGASMVTKADADPLLERAALDRMSGFYVVDQDRRNPLLSPAVTADLTGLPPILVCHSSLRSTMRRAAASWTRESGAP